MGNLCIDLFKVMEKRQLASYIVNPGADLMTGLSIGKLGGALYVSPNEL